MSGEHEARMTSWITVILIIVASVLYGFALPMHSMTLAIAGTVVLLAGLITGAVYRIMDDAY